MSKGRRRSRSGKSFVMLGRGMLNGPEWMKLSAGAKLLYVYLKNRFNGANNGEIALPYSALKGVRGLSSTSTISKAHKELEREGWVTRKNLGGMFRKINKYELTGKYDGYLSPKR